MENEVREQYPVPPQIYTDAAEQTEHSPEELVIKDASFYLTKAQISAAKKLAEYIEDDSKNGFDVSVTYDTYQTEQALWLVYAIGAVAKGQGDKVFRANPE